MIEEVFSDEDIDRIKHKYVVQKGDGAFAHLNDELNSKTYAVLMQRNNAVSSDRDHYVAVIDCRGAKAQRRFFTRWHEIAHVLTLYKQLALPLHRSCDDGTPLERLMDTIAGEVGFYGPLFEPMLASALQKHGRLSFAVVEELREEFCPEASFQATLIACVKRTALPAAYIEIGSGYKRDEKRQLESGQGLFGWEDVPKPKLRILNCSSNRSAKEKGILFHRNMEVPARSSLVGGTRPEVAVEEHGRESLQIWTHSDGSSLGETVVQMESRDLSNSLIVLVTDG